MIHDANNETIGDKIIEFLIRENGNTRFSIAFLPYCFEMWDCMESVYLSATKHGLDTAVFPIPYFTLKDGRINEWVYDYWKFEGEVDEKDLFDFNKYFEVMDEIDYVVIHNPYDDGNNLTTVHPFFYSNVLKEQGKKIIFIPYGIPCGGVSNDTMRLQKGALNADYIFVNGEDEKREFIKTFNKIGVDMTKRCYCFGSPKLDVLRKQYELPFSWKKKIHRQVTLICTSLIAFMNDDPIKRIEKYRKAIDRELEKGNMVIFRPHPLMDGMIENKFSNEIYEKWVNLISYVDNVAILDIDNEIGMAMQYSKYLISDPSSVVEVWKETGKPYEVLE